MRRAGRSFRLLAAATVLMSTVAACTGAHHLGAAEPATAPPASVAPAGLVRPVGGAPEGIVYDATTGLVAVAVRTPDRLLLLDPTTLATDRSIPLPGSVRHLQLAAPGGPVLVPIETSNELGEVTLPSGTLSSVVGVGRQPHDATAVGAGRVAVGNEFGRSISLISDGQVIATLTGVRQPGGLVGDGDTLAAVDVASFTVDTFDLSTDRRTASVPAGAGPTHAVLLSGQRILVVDTRGNAVLVFGLSPLRLLGRMNLPGTPYGVAVDAATDTVWVTLTALNQVVGLDVRTNSPRLVARYPTVSQPNTVAVAPDSTSIWITGTATGTVEHITR